MALDCASARDRLEEYRRGELARAEAALVAVHLEACEACRAARARDDAVVALVGTLPRPPAPPALAARIAALGAPPAGARRWLGRPWVAALGAAAVVALAVAPWVRPGPGRPGDPVEALLRAGIAEHRRILMQLEVAPAEPAPPDVLLERVRTATALQVPRAFAGAGDLRLLTARATLLAERKSAAAALQAPASPVTTYFVVPGRDLPVPADGRQEIGPYRPYVREVDDFSVYYWKQGDLAYLMVSGPDQEICKSLFLKMRQAL
jgi:hypothetical protein